MSSTASSFTPPWTGAPDYIHLGSPTNLVEACAWRMLVLIRDQKPFSQPGNQEMLRYALSKLSGVEQAFCKDRAQALDQELRVSPALTPPVDWYPRLPGDKPAKPGARHADRDLITTVPPDPACLDRTACAIGQDCPPFVPPPGCPTRR